MYLRSNWHTIKIIHKLVLCGVTERYHFQIITEASMFLLDNAYIILEICIFEAHAFKNAGSVRLSLSGSHTYTYVTQEAATCNVCSCM